MRSPAGRVNTGSTQDLRSSKLFASLRSSRCWQRSRCRLFPGTSLPGIEAYALETAALLNADHDAAQRQHRDIATVTYAATRTIRSRASGHALQMPSDVTVQSLLAARCNDQAADQTIRYLASGMSCGGAVSLTRDGMGDRVRVNWLTGGAEAVPAR